MLKSLSVMKDTKNRIDYYEENGKIKYNYPLKNNQGYVYLWHETELSHYKSIEFSKHAKEQLKKRDLTEQNIIEFFNEAKIKIAWIPDYNTDNGENVRVVGKHPKIGFLTIITAIDTGPLNQLEVFTAYKIGKNKKDIAIWKLGMEKIAQLEEKNLIPDEDLIINNIPKASSTINKPVKDTPLSPTPPTNQPPNNSLSR